MGQCLSCAQDREYPLVSLSINCACFRSQTDHTDRGAQSIFSIDYEEIQRRRKKTHRRSYSI